MDSATPKQIKGEIYRALRSGLTEPKKGSKTSWAESFIQTMLDEAKKKPSGALGQLLAKQLLQEDIITSLDTETEKLLARDIDFLQYRVLKELYDKQREVVYDYKIPRKVLCTSRRAGKTTLAAKMSVYYAIEPKTPVLYIHNKMENALRQFFPIVLETAKKAEVPIVKQDKNTGYVEFANGSSISCASNKDKTSAASLRGGHYKLIIIDEAQDMRNMVELVEDVCEPMLVDFKDSSLMLIGTPPRRPKTYFMNAFKNKEWKPYHFTMLDNPYIPDPESFIEKIAKEKGVTLEDPLILREYRGLEYFDTTAMVFQNFKTYKEIPKDFVPEKVYIGNDYGWSAYNAIIGVAVNLTEKRGYVYYEKKFNKASVTDIVEKNKEALEEGKKLLLRNPQIDIGGKIAIYGDYSDQSIIYEMVTTYRLPAYKCYKYDKMNAITQLGEDLRTIISIPEGGVLEDEFLQTLYKRDEEDNVLPEIDDEVYHPDAVFALLYASRQWHFDLSVTQNY